MANILNIHVLAIVIAAPGMFILGLTSISLLSWTYRRDVGFPFRFERCSDEVSLVRTGLDLTYGLFSVGTSWFIEVFSFAREISFVREIGISPTVFWLVFVAMLLYPFLYYRRICPSLTSLRLAVRNRVPTEQRGP